MYLLKRILRKVLLTSFSDIMLCSVPGNPGKEQPETLALPKPGTTRKTIGLSRVSRRGRLVAYGARLESVLGASPRGFESLSLRQIKRSTPSRSFYLAGIRTRQVSEKRTKGSGRARTRAGMYSEDVESVLNTSWLKWYNTNILCLL